MSGGVIGVHTLEVVNIVAFHVQVTVLLGLLVKFVLLEHTLALVRPLARLVGRANILAQAREGVRLVRRTRERHAVDVLLRPVAPAISALPAPTEVHAPLASPASTKSPLVLPRAQTARQQNTPQHWLRPLPRPVLHVLPVPARPLPARPSLLARATSATPDQTAACAPLAQPENTKLRQARSRAQIAEPARTRQQWAQRLPRPASRVRQTPAICALYALLRLVVHATRVTQARWEARVLHAQPENTKA